MRRLISATVPSLLRESFTTTAIVTALAITVAACGGDALRELPLAEARVDRAGILRVRATSGRDAWLLHRSSRSGPRAPADLAYWNGGSLALVDLPDDAGAGSIAPVAAGRVVVGGTKVLEVEGTRVTDITAQLTGAVGWLVAGRGDGAVYAAGFANNAGVLLRRGAGETAFAPAAAAPPGELSELVVAGPDRLVGVGSGNATTASAFYHYDGTAWSPPSTQLGRAPSAAAPDDVWALPLASASTPMEVLSWNGTAWSSVTVTIREAQVSGSSGTSSVYAVVALGAGRAGAIVRRDYNTVPLRRELLWVTGDRMGLRSDQVVRVYCDGCADGNEFTGPGDRASDGTVFVGPYYGVLP